MLKDDLPSKGSPDESWPKEKPPLVKYFIERGIWDADSMSEEIL